MACAVITACKNVEDVPRGLQSFCSDETDQVSTKDTCSRVQSHPRRSELSPTIAYKDMLHTLPHLQDPAHMAVRMHGSVRGRGRGGGGGGRGAES
jgi:hypothetical protein